MPTKKISELSAVLGVDITPSTDVIIINDGDVTKKITINELLSNLDNITVAQTGSFGRVEVEGFITASNLGVDANTLFIGGTPFNKSELDRLKEGKTITTTENRLVKRKAVPGKSSRPTKGTSTTQTLDDIQRVDAIVNNVDDTTFIQTNTTGAFDIVINNTSSLAITTDRVDISVPVFLPSITGSTSFTGSTEFSGSTTVSGSFTVTDVLTVLANFGQTGSFNVSGSTTLDGDVNLDGTVTVTDLLTVVAGFGASGSSSNTGSFENSGSFSNEGETEFTGSTEFSGSTVVSGGMSHEGSTDTLPPPVVASVLPENETLFYGYNFAGAAGGNIPEAKEVLGAGGWDPNDITHFLFSTESQLSFGNPWTSSDATDVLSGLAASSSAQRSAILEFNPAIGTTGADVFSYKFQTSNWENSFTSSGYYKVNISNFIESSSLTGGTVPSIIPTSTSSGVSVSYLSPTSSNGRFHFTVPPPPSNPPEGGFNVGDLLNVLSAFGQSSVPVGSIGDYNFDGAVNITDLLFVLGGYATSNTICNNIIIPPNTNHQLIGPEISICDGNFFIISTGSISSITL